MWEFLRGENAGDCVLEREMLLKNRNEGLNRGLALAIRNTTALVFPGQWSLSGILSCSLAQEWQVASLLTHKF